VEILDYAPGVVDPVLWARVFEIPFAIARAEVIEPSDAATPLPKLPGKALKHGKRGFRFFTERIADDQRIARC